MPENKENFTKLDNTLLELMTHGYFTLNEIRVLLVILRHTAGWQKESERLSTPFLSQRTGIKERNIHTALKGLKEKDVISISYDGKKRVKRISITHDKFYPLIDSITGLNLSRYPCQNLSGYPCQNLSGVTPLKPLQSEGCSAPKETPLKETPLKESVLFEKDQRNSRKQERKPSTRKTVHRKLYGQFNNVPFSDEEMDKLKELYPEDWAERIERVSEFAASTGKIYKNGLATIQNWDRRDKEKQPQKIQSQPKPAGPRFNP